MSGRYEQIVKAAVLAQELLDIIRTKDLRNGYMALLTAAAIVARNLDVDSSTFTADAVMTYRLSPTSVDVKNVS